MTARIFVTGEYFCDLVFGTLPTAPEAGREVFATGLEIVPGGTFNIAAGLARAGVPCAWGVEFGTDAFSKMVREAAIAAHVDPVAFRSLPYPVPRLSAAFSVGGDRGFISASAEPVRPVPVSELRPEWVVQTFRFTPDWIAFAQQAKAGGARLYGDCRDVAATLTTPGVADLVACLDVFAPSASEAMRLTGTTSAHLALDVLAPLVPVAIVTLGSDGAIWAGEGQRGHTPAPVVRVTDTIGAGDAFNCGYLAAALAGCNLPQRIEAGVVFGAEAVTRAGGGHPPDGRAIMTFAAESGFTLDPRLSAFLAGGPARHTTNDKKKQPGPSHQGA